MNSAIILDYVIIVYIITLHLLAQDNGHVGQLRLPIHLVYIITLSFYFQVVSHILNECSSEHFAITESYKPIQAEY